MNQWQLCNTIHRLSGRTHCYISHCCVFMKSRKLLKCRFLDSFAKTTDTVSHRRDHVPAKEAVVNSGHIAFVFIRTFPTRQLIFTRFREIQTIYRSVQKCETVSVRDNETKTNISACKYDSVRVGYRARMYAWHECFLQTQYRKQITLILFFFFILQCLL